MKVAIVGSRGFKPLSQVSEYVGSLRDGDVVVSGGARGVDITAERAAKKRGLEVEIFPANWERFGPSAGYIRNTLIVRACDRIVAFWDGKSKGTQHTIDLGHAAKKDVRIIYQAKV